MSYQKTKPPLEGFLSDLWNATPAAKLIDYLTEDSAEEKAAKVRAEAEAKLARERAANAAAGAQRGGLLAPTLVVPEYALPQTFSPLAPKSLANVIAENKLLLGVGVGLAGYWYWRNK